MFPSELGPRRVAGDNQPEVISLGKHSLVGWSAPQAKPLSVLVFQSLACWTRPQTESLLLGEGLTLEGERRQHARIYAREKEAVHREGEGMTDPKRVCTTDRHGCWPGSSAFSESLDCTVVAWFFFSCFSPSFSSFQSLCIALALSI